jgi:hypothetical protein
MPPSCSAELIVYPRVAAPAATGAGQTMDWKRRNTMKVLRVITWLLLASALPIASARTYPVMLYQPMLVSGELLPAGEYMVDVKDSQIVIQGHGKKVATAATVHTEDTKWESTAVKYNTAGKAWELQEIRIGGTKLHIVLGEPVRAGVTPATGAKASAR